MSLHYSLYGLVVASEFELPELSEFSSANADVQIFRSAVRQEYVASPSLVRFSIARVARFEIRNGNKIAVDPAAGADPAQVRLFLLGSAMAAVLHQRGMFALHANSIVIDDRAFAFMGRSGTGKSTLAAWFAGQGCAVLSDDVCAISQRPDGSFEVWPGVPRIRLFEDSAEANDLETENLPLITFADGWQKFVVALPSVEESVPLCAIYLLDGDATGIGRLGGLEAFEALSANSYRGEMIAMFGEAETHYTDVLALARSVPVYRAMRGSTLGDWRAGEAMLNHARQLSTKGIIPQESG